jgi:hypothetical protein
MEKPLVYSRLAQFQGRPTARQAQGNRQEEDRKSQGRSVIERIRLRRSGLEWQESMWNRLNREKQMTGDFSRLVRPEAASKERSDNGHKPVLPNGPGSSCCVLTMQALSRAVEHSRTGMFLERLEPCEGKLSRTVLRGAWAG